jgi:hypothetical protein
MQYLNMQIDAFFKGEMHKTFVAYKQSGKKMQMLFRVAQF